MPNEPESKDQEGAPLCLTLRSRLSDLALVHPWVETLAARYALPERTIFAIDLCLEEAVTNIIRHGYAGDTSQTVEIECTISGEREVSFVIEDSAPQFQPFDPATPSQKPIAVTLEEIVPGGQGVTLMRKFANTVEWQPLPNGNRLTLRFSRS